MPPSPSRRRTLTPAAFPVALALLVILSGCGPEERRGDLDLQVAVSVDPDPPRVGTADVQIRVADVDWSPRNGDRVILRGVRDSIVLTQDTAVGQGAGLYLAEALPFPVRGSWILTVRVEARDGRWVEVDEALRVEAEAP